MSLAASVVVIRSLGNTTTNAGLMVDGLKVVGAQEASIANSNSSNANIGPAADGLHVTINTILVAMRNHGLIANTNTISSTAVAKVTRRSATNSNAGLFVNDLRVVGEQIANTNLLNTAIANNATNSADLTVTVNAIIAALRSHGLIA